MIASIRSSDGGIAPNDSKVRLLARKFAWFAAGSLLYKKRLFNFRLNQENLQKINACGKTFLVTYDCNSIGKVVACYLAGMEGTTVHIVCSDEEYGKRSAAEAQNGSHPSSKVFLHIVDLADPRSVVDFCAEHIQRKESLDAIVHCAGIISPDKVMTPCGLEKSFAMNVVAPYLLTELLIDHLIASSKEDQRPRVVILTSRAMSMVDLNPMDPCLANRMDYDGDAAYIQHKRQQVVLADIWAEKHPEIQFSTMHPGWVNTVSLEQTLPNFLGRGVVKLRDPEEGADTLLWLTLSSNALKHPSGSFYFGRSVEKKSLLGREKKRDPTTERTYLQTLRSMVKEALRYDLENASSNVWDLCTRLSGEGEEKASVA